MNKTSSLHHTQSMILMIWADLLAEFYKKLNEKGCKLMLSNSYHLEFFGKLYLGCNIKKVIAKRVINSKRDKERYLWIIDNELLCGECGFNIPPCNIFPHDL